VAIEIRETFQVAAPVEKVWRFVMDPNKVAACMPGASLEQVVDERTFVGSIKVKVGAVMASYKGRIELVDVDEKNRTVEMKAEGRETGGGTARGKMTSRLTPLANGGTEVVAEASVDLTGRIVKGGRGMIEGVSHQLFLQFVARARQSLEAEPLAASSGSSVETPAPVKQEEALRVMPLIFAALWASILGFFRRLFGGRSAEAGKQ
jgi:carbon monoxide dehydrogenase subunit G